MAVKKTGKPAAKKPAPAKKTAAAPAVKKEVAVIQTPFWNIWDAGTEYKVRLSIPGLSKKNIHIDVDGNRLTVSGKKESSSKKEGKNFLVQEYSYDSWSKSVSLPQQVKEEDVKISYKDGVLKMSLQKLTPSK